MNITTQSSLEIKQGRQGYAWTAVPDWTAFAGYTTAAQHLYRLLRMHANTRRGDGLVWPTQDTLAKLMGLSRGDKVVRYLAELARPLPGCDPGDGGAIGIEYTSTMPRRAIYTVHDTPPGGWTGPATLGQWYRLQRPPAAAAGTPPARLSTAPSTPASTPASSMPDATPEFAQNGPDVTDSNQESDIPTGAPTTKPQVTPVAPKTGVLGGATKPQVTPVAPSRGVLVTPSGGHKQEEVQPDESSSSRAATSSSVAGQAPGRRRTHRTGQDAPAMAAARGVLAEATRGLTAARQPDRAQAEDITVAIATAIAAGWDTKALSVRLGDGLDRSDSPTAVLRYRLQQLPDLTANRPAQPTTPRPRHCGTCYEPTRMAIDDQDRPVPCPACHPEASRTVGATR